MKKKKKIISIFNYKILLSPLIIFLLLTPICFSFSKELKKSTNHPLITVLCYHHIDLKIRTPYSVTTEQFNNQLDALVAAGFKFISIQQLDDYLYNGETIPTLSAVITFDDGNISAYTKAYPILKRRKIPWACFIYPSITNGGHRNYCASWDEVRKMAKNGVTIGCHSYTHPFLTSPPEDVTTPKQYDKWLNREIIDSKKVIERKIGKPVEYFAVPFGAFDTTVYNKIKQSGYRLSFNVHGMNNGQFTDPYNVNRIVIEANCTLPNFVTLVTAQPIYFDYLYPADLSRTIINNPDVRFSIKDLNQYQEKTIRLKVTRFDGVYPTKLKNEDMFDEQIVLKKPRYYFCSVFALDKIGRRCRGNWLFLYNKTIHSFVPPQNIIIK